MTWSVTHHYHLPGRLHAKRLDEDEILTRKLAGIIEIFIEDTRKDLIHRRPTAWRYASSKWRHDCHSRGELQQSGAASSLALSSNEL